MKLSLGYFSLNSASSASRPFFSDPAAHQVKTPTSPPAPPAFVACDDVELELDDEPVFASPVAQAVRVRAAVVNATADSRVVLRMDCLLMGLVLTAGLPGVKGSVGRVAGVMSLFLLYSGGQDAGRERDGSAERSGPATTCPGSRDGEQRRAVTAPSTTTSPVACGISSV